MKIVSTRRTPKGKERPAPLASAADRPGGQGALRITEVHTREALHQLSRLSVRIGVPAPRGQDAGDTYRVEIDPQANGIATEHARSLSDHPEVARRSGITPEDLEGARLQAQALSGVRDRSGDLIADLTLARKALGMVQRKAGDRIEDAIPALLARPGLSRRERDRLLDCQDRLKRLREQAQKQKDQQAAKTRKDKARGQAQLDEAQRRLDEARARSQGPGDAQG